MLWLCFSIPFNHETIIKVNDPSKNEKYKEDPNFIASVTGAVYDNQKVSVLKEILTNLYAERKINKNKHLEIERKFSKLKK